MSKGQKAISAFIYDHYDQAVFMTAARLGDTVGVSESTVVRYAMFIGYNGYPEFQRDLEDWVQNKINSVQKIGAKYGRSTQSEILTSVLQADIEKLQDTIHKLDPTAFETAVDIILEAKTVYVMGVRSCDPLAEFLNFYLNMIRGNVILLKTTSVSETFESNGSTSMASTCASCMSLMAAGVPVKKMVAGISCGLVTGETDDEYVLLTDIQGLEDFFGDMDFKVTGTTEGITAIQMDIKIHGLTRPIVEGAIRRCREAREFIMDTCMKPVIAGPRPQISKYAPKIMQIQIDPEKIGDVVGQRGKTINTIIERTGVKIDISDYGAVSVCGTDQAMIDQAIDMVKIIVTDFEAGQVFTGKVVSIKEFGAFIEFAPGKEGMVHISKIARERINRVEDVLTLGDKVTVVCLGKDKMGRISFSMKDVAQK